MAEKSRLWFCVAAVLALPGMAFAANTLSIDAGIGHSSNALLGSTNERGSTLGSIGLNVNAVRDRGLLQLAANGAMNYRYFFDSDIPGQIGGSLGLSATVGPKDGAFSWFVSDSVGTTREELFRAQGPDNTQLVNEFSTGPDLRLRFGTEWMLKAQARYATTMYETAQADNRRSGGRLEMLRQLAAARSIGLGASLEREEYDQLTGSERNYDREEVFGNFNWGSARGELKVEIGATKLKPKFAGASPQSGSLARITLTRTLSGSSSLNFSAAREFSGVSQSLSQLSVSSLTQSTFSSSLALNEPPLLERALAGYKWSHARTSVGVTVARSKESYRSVSGAERSITEYAVQAERALTPKSRVGGYFRKADEKFGGTIGDSNEQRFGAYWSLLLGRALELKVTVEKGERSADTANFNFEETIGLVTLRYSLLRGT